MLDIPTHLIRTNKRTIRDVQAKKKAGLVSVLFKAGKRNELTEAAELLIRMNIHPLIFKMYPSIFPSWRMK